MENARQLNLGWVLLKTAARCWYLIPAVPQEHEAGLERQIEELTFGALLFGCEEARDPYGRLHVQRDGGDFCI